MRSPPRGRQTIWRQASAELHRRLVELSGNATLAMIAGMLHDISERHTTAVILRQQNVVPKAQFSSC
jgi:DNA-binding FadR family transcriptional regulator